MIFINALFIGVIDFLVALKRTISGALLHLALKSLAIRHLIKTIYDCTTNDTFKMDTQN